VLNPTTTADRTVPLNPMTTQARARDVESESAREQRRTDASVRIARTLCVALCGTVLLISIFETPAFLSSLHVCLFKRLTGLPCPGCGLTRAFQAMSHGEFRAVWHLNPFAFVLYPATWLLFLGALLYPWLPPRLLSNARRMAPAVVAATGLLMLAFGAWRIWAVLTIGTTAR
jgi:hypothetical protein